MSKTIYALRHYFFCIVEIIHMSGDLQMMQMGFSNYGAGHCIWHTMFEAMKLVVDPKLNYVNSFSS